LIDSKVNPVGTGVLSLDDRTC